MGERGCGGNVSGYPLILHLPVERLSYLGNAIQGDLMARGKPVDLGTLTFATRQEALGHFKAMLARYRPEQTVGDADALELAELIKRHPERAEKVGPGVHHFEVMHAEFNTKCFAIVRTNGTRVDFSYRVCVNSGP